MIAAQYKGYGLEIERGEQFVVSIWRWHHVMDTDPFEDPEAALTAAYGIIDTRVELQQELQRDIQNT